jgi:hypothetical protein
MKVRPRSYSKEFPHRGSIACLHKAWELSLGFYFFFAHGRYGFLMGMITIRCPKTRQGVSTGRYVEPTTFRSSPVFFSRTYCPLCRSMHEWFAKEVETESAVALMVGTFEALAADPKLSHGEALQKAMLAVIENTQHSEWADPKYSAPFVVVGEPAKQAN